MSRLHAVCLTLVLAGTTAPAQTPPAAVREKAQADRAEARLRRLLMELAPVPLPHSQRVTSIAFSADGRTVTTVSNTVPTVFVWDSATGKLLRQWRLPQRWLVRTAVGAGGSLVATADRTGRVEVWDVAKGKRLHVLKGTAGPCLALAPDGKSVVAGLADGRLGVWDVATAKQRATLPKSGWTTNLPLAVSPDGKLIAAERPDGSIGIWDANGGKEVQALPAGTSAARLLTFTPNGKGLATCDRAGLVRLWDVASARQRKEVQLPPDHPLTSGTFTPDGRTLVTGGVDGTVRLWELASGKERYRFAPLADQVTQATLTTDGQAVAMVGGDNLTLVRAVGGLPPAGGVLGAAQRPKTLEAAWADLAASDAAAAYRALTALAERPAAAVEFLKGRVKPATAAETTEIARLLANLNDRAFAVRQKAMKRLEQLHDAAEPALEALLQTNPPAEARRRVEQLLSRIKALTIPPERLRMLRAVEVLESIGTVQARQVLQGLARGAAQAPLTMEARTALERLKNRPAPMR